MPANRRQDPFANAAFTLSDPASNASAVTPSDSTDLTIYAKSLYVGGAGSLVVIMVNEQNDATTVTFSGIPAGAILPIRVRRVLATGTTATAIVALRD